MIATIQFHSESLLRQMSYTALIPDKAPGPFPVLLQLHGYFGNHMDWLTQSNLARYARDYPFLIVMPSGEN